MMREDIFCCDIAITPVVLWQLACTASFKYDLTCSIQAMQY